MKLIDIIKESRNLGDVYHFTNLKGMIGILDSNIMRPSNIDIDYKTARPYVSTTRDKNFANSRGVQETWISGDLFRIKLDGNKLSARYKSRSHDDRYSYYTKSFNPSKVEYGDEMEERFLVPHEGIKNIKNYIKEIAINKTIFTPFNVSALRRNIRHLKDYSEKIIGLDFYEISADSNPIQIVNNIKKYFLDNYGYNLELG